MTRFATYLACILLAVLVTGCTKDQSKLNTCIACVPTSFHADILPILQNNCALSGCHDAGDAEGSLVLDSAVAYSQLNSQGSGYLVPGDPGASIFYNELSRSSSEPMPPDNPLDPCSIERIKCWIQDGAKNN